MTSPVLFVVDDDTGSLGTLDGTLRRRYGRDYLVIAESSPEAALGRLRELRAADSPVAVVMASSAMSAAPAAEFSRTPAPSHRPPSGCWWCRGAARPRPACVFRCRWWLTGRRLHPSCAR
jgi:hypothetical protein